MVHHRLARDPGACERALEVGRSQDPPAPYARFGHAIAAGGAELHGRGKLLRAGTPRFEVAEPWHVLGTPRHHHRRSLAHEGDDALARFLGNEAQRGQHEHAVAAAAARDEGRPGVFLPPGGGLACVNVPQLPV
jgi:hypothetical protein